MADQPIENKTLTDLQVLQNLEKAYYKNNPNSVKRNTLKSLEWFRKYIPRSLNRVNHNQMFKDKKLQKKRITPGKMYFFEYDAIHKETLPVWDRYPLIFPWDSWRNENTGKLYMIGINLHYLPPAKRFAVMKVLLTIKTEKRFRKSTKLAIKNFETLTKLGNSKFFEHAVKIYRLDAVKSPFVEIPSASWEMAVFLPLARWQKGSKATAWKIK